MVHSLVVSHLAFWCPCVGGLGRSGHNATFKLANETIVPFSVTACHVGQSFHPAGSSALLASEHRHPAAAWGYSAGVCNVVGIYPVITLTSYSQNAVVVVVVVVVVVDRFDLKIA